MRFLPTIRRKQKPAKSSIDVLNERYISAIGELMIRNHIPCQLVGKPTRGSRHITYNLNLFNPDDLKKVIIKDESLALGCRSESAFIYRRNGVVTIQITLPTEHRLKVERGVNVTGKQIGMIDRNRMVEFDLESSAPHSLISGTTGTGKSYLATNVLLSIIETNSPKNCRIVLIDPNTDFDKFENLPHFVNFSYGYRSIMYEQHLKSLRWVNKIFEHRRDNQIKDDYRLVLLIDECEQIDNKATSAFWKTLELIAAQGRKYNINVILTSKRPMVKEIPALHLFTNRYIGRLDVHKSVASALVQSVESFNPSKLSLHGDFINENDVQFHRFQVADIKSKVFDSLTRSTIHQVNESKEILLNPTVGRPRIEVSPKLLAYYTARKFKVSERQARADGITQTEHNLHLNFGKEYLSEIKAEVKRMKEG